MDNSNPAKKKALLWFESHLGAGDAKLSFNLAEGLARNGYEVYLASSSIERWQHIFNVNPHIHFVNLPPLDRKQDQRYYTPSGSTFPKDKDYVAKRSEVLLSALHDIDPAVVITQSWPIGRNHFDEEMLALMKDIRAHKPRPVLACYPCDANFVTTDDSGRQKERKAQFIEQLPDFDCILVPGDKMLNFAEHIPAIKPFEDKIHYTGYMVEDFNTTPSKTTEEVLVCSGGGWHDSDLPFYLAAIRSRQYTLNHDDVWRIKVSRNLCPDAMYNEIVEAAKQQDLTDRKIIVEPNDDKFRQQMVDAKAVIIRSGYNTLTEAVYAGKPTVTIPRPYKGADREQQERAVALHKLGCVKAVTHAELLNIIEHGDYARLGSIIDSASQNKTTPRMPIDMHGADNAAYFLDSLIQSRFSGVPSAAVTGASGSPVIEMQHRRGAV